MKRKRERNESSPEGTGSRSKEAKISIDDNSRWSKGVTTGLLFKTDDASKVDFSLPRKEVQATSPKTDVADLLISASKVANIAVALEELADRNTNTKKEIN